jgi:hypothetical protein
MHGLIFVTWEKYLAERFGPAFLNDYRKTIGETPANAPLTSKTYNDDVLLKGVGAASKLSQFPVETLLREYGRYFIINGLTSHLCAYLLRQVHSGRDLLLKMKSAHAQMRMTPDSLTPPLFNYEIFSPDQNYFALIYDSPRQLCPVLLGAIEGAAERYHEQVQVMERTCMKFGAAVCRFEVHFMPTKQQDNIVPSEQEARLDAQQKLIEFVLMILPDREGVTLNELLAMLQMYKAQIDRQLLRPSLLLDALRRLQHAGLVSSTANQPGDDFVHRRYWRTPAVTDIH